MFRYVALLLLRNEECANTARQLFHKCSAHSARAILRTTYNTTLESVLHQTSEYSSLRRHCIIDREICAVGIEGPTDLPGFRVR